jgi:hypothetical protein
MWQEEDLNPGQLQSPSPDSLRGHGLEHLLPRNRAHLVQDSALSLFGGVGWPRSLVLSETQGWDGTQGFILAGQMSTSELHLSPENINCHSSQNGSI